MSLLFVIKRSNRPLNKFINDKVNLFVKLIDSMTGESLGNIMWRHLIVMKYKTTLSYRGFREYALNSSGTATITRPQTYNEWLIKWEFAVIVRTVIVMTTAQLLHAASLLRNQAWHTLTASTNSLWSPAGEANININPCPQYFVVSFSGCS